MVDKRFTLINRTDYPSKQLENIAGALLEGQQAPSFYLICQTPKHDGLSISNIDKPFIIIDIENLYQFAEVFVHELMHLQQHTKGYASEDFSKEVVVTDKHKTGEDKV
jgi:Zn-dependent peptidase ImmA (M78 family)